MRASEIVPLVKSTFEDLDVRHYHGSVLHHALDERFYREYDAENPADRQLIDLLTSIERSMIEMGEIGSDNAHIVARKS